MRMTRRVFVRRAAAAAGLAAGPWVIPATAWGQGSTPAPSNRLTMGIIGTGSMGRHNIGSMLQQPDVRIVALCDVHSGRRAQARQMVDEFYGNTDCAEYTDFRELLARDDIDTVLIATPDHWHALVSIAAARAGKDVYCEKPISLTVAEGRAVADAMRRYGTVYQSGTQRRSIECFAFPIQVARSGMLGRIHTIRTYLGKGRTIGIEPPQPIPEGFDYDLWLGPAPYKPYTERRCFGSFRFIYDYSGGVLTDIGAHFHDLAQWANDSEATGPVLYEGSGRFPEEGLFDTPTDYELTATYADGVKLVFHDESPFAIRIEGDEGWASVIDTGLVDAEPKSILDVRAVQQQDYEYMSGHHRNFLDCVKTRSTPVAPPEVAHRSTTICHIGNICLRLGRNLRWDPERERFIDDPEADAMLSRAMRAPWHL